MKIKAIVVTLSVFLSGFISREVHAAPHRAVAKPAPLGRYVAAGAIAGGSAGKGFSILRASQTKAPDGAERFVIVYGDARGRTVKTSPGYFHIQVDKKSPRVSIDLAQVQMTTLDPEQLQKLFRGSKLVAETEMTMDPIDLSTNITLRLRAPVEARANIESRNGTQVLVIDMRPRGGRG